MPNIKGSKGTWTVNKDKDHLGTKDRIRITFTPNKEENGCKDIRLSQSVKIVGYNAEGGVVAKTFKGVYKREFFAHMEDDRATDDGGDVVIDHVACEADPFYNGDDSKHDATSKGDATSEPPKGTSMSDTPGGNSFNVFKAGITKVVYTFETCAICVATGEILGCIIWTMERTAGDNGDITLPTSEEDKVSDGFKKAMKKFVEKHSKEKAGKLQWHCPDVTGSVEGPNGGSDAFGGEIPGGFLKKWGKESEKENKTKQMKPDREQSGAGRKYEERNKAIRDAHRHPERTLVKLTWAGEQIKTILSCAFTAYEALTVEDISPLIPKEAHFANDYAGINIAEASPEWMQNLLLELALRSEHCEAIEQQDSLVNIMTGLGTEEAAYFSFSIKPAVVTEWMQAIAPHVDTDEALLEAVQYAARNLGRP